MFPCEVKEQAARPTLTVRFRSPVQDLPKHFGHIYGMIMAHLGSHQAAPSGPPFAVYYNMDMQHLDIEAGFPVPRPMAGSGEIEAHEIPAGLFAVCHYVGPYDGIGPGYSQLTQFVRISGYETLGPAYEFYLDDANVNPKDTRTDIVFPVKRIEHIEPA